MRLHPLPELLARQHYRLASWRIANDAINWRRFFDINELAGAAHGACRRRSRIRMR